MSDDIEFETFPDGFVVLGDSTTEFVFAFCVQLAKSLKEDANFECVIVTDPPYGNIVSEKWDRIKESDDQFAHWMLSWTMLWSTLLPAGGAFYIWGGLGKPRFRPFLKFIPRVEENTELQCHNVITWSKKRAYGVQHNYLFTREELAYFVKGDPKHPRIFNVPYLDEKRGYDGYDSDHPAKSEYLRRTNVWKDVTEIFRGKTHECQKPDKVYEIPILASSVEGDVIVDIFAGSGTAAKAARKHGRKFVLVENNREDYEKICKSLR